MKKKIISASLLIFASTFTSHASAVPVNSATLDLQDYHLSGINNQWFNTGDLNNLFHGLSPYTKSSTDGTGSITLSPIVNVADAGHIHVSGALSSDTPTLPYIHGDVGGIFIAGSNSLSTFSLHSMDILATAFRSNADVHQNATVTVRGYLGGTNGMMTGSAESDMTMIYKGGSQVASAIITENDAFQAFDFLNSDTGFGEVDYVELFFTDFYRYKPVDSGDTALLLEFDNILVGTAISTPAAVPVPAAAWLFGTGLIGLTSLRKRKNA